jgi:hypothetical protein
MQQIQVRQFQISEEKPRIFQPLQIKLGKGEGMEAGTAQVEFTAPQRTKSKVLLTKKGVWSGIFWSGNRGSIKPQEVL